MRLIFLFLSKLLEKLVVNYHPNTEAFLRKISREFMRGVSNDPDEYFSDFIKASVVGTHLNCLDLSRQFK